MLPGDLGVKSISSPGEPLQPDLRDRQFLMRIVLASSEAVPFSKTGGLADVASALPKALAQAGHEVSLITPYFPQIFARQSGDLPEIDQSGQILPISLGSKQQGVKLAQD